MQQQHASLRFPFLKFKKILFTTHKEAQSNLPTREAQNSLAGIKNLNKFLKKKEGT